MVLITILVTGAVAYLLFASVLRENVEHKLMALMQTRLETLDRYFDDIRRDVIYHAQSAQVVDALKRFRFAWHMMGENASGELYELYIHRNPHSFDNRSLLLDPGDGSQYSVTHRHFHDAFRALRIARGYYDIFLFDPAGNLVYTVVKEPDFSSNMLTGRWQESGLSSALRQVLEDPSRNQPIFVDFAPYQPSRGAPAGFIAMPVYSQEEEFLGVLAFQMPIDRMNEVLNAPAGLGEGGEINLIGKDFLMRNQSRFLDQDTFLKIELDNKAVREALDGRSGIGFYRDYQEREALTSYAPVRFLGTSWALIASMHTEELEAPVQELQRYLMIGGVFLILLAVISSRRLARSLSRPILQINNSMIRLANGDLAQEIPGQDLKDEIGDMARALEVFRENGKIRREIQKEVKRQRDELQRLNHQKNKFFSIVAHDLKSPFNALVGYSELLAEQNRELSRDQIDDYAKTLNEAIYQLLDLLENLLEWSRNQMNSISFEPEDCEVAQLVRQTSHLLQRNWESKGQTLVLECDDMIVHADPNMLKTVLRNLMSNAIKFTPNGGLIKVYCLDLDHQIEIAVRDEGIGMSPEHLKSVFDQGGTVSTSGTEGERGTGLGLVLCREFVERMAGVIWAESVEGEGTVVRLTLPKGAVMGVGKDQLAKPA